MPSVESVRWLDADVGVAGCVEEEVCGTEVAVLEDEHSDAGF